MDESLLLLNADELAEQYSDVLNNDFRKVKDEKFCEKVQDVSSSRIGSENVAIAHVVCQTYWYRWYICLIFSFLGLLQGAIWNTWGPMNESAKAVFGFSAVMMPFFMWLLDNKGLRLSVVSTACLVALGTGLRCLPFDAFISRYFIHAGQIFNGMAGCVLSAAPPFLSNMWFPPHERITATGIATLLTYMGSGLAYSIGMIVDVPSNSSKNHSVCIHVYSSQNMTCKEIVHIRGQIKGIFYVEFALSMAVFVSMLIFFPKRPPKPPSISAALPRVNLKAGLLELRHRRQFWVVATVLALALGTWAGWSGVMPIIVKPLGFSQSQAGLMGTVLSVAGNITGILFGWFTDRLKGRMKLMLTILLSSVLVVVIYFIIISNKWIKVVPFLPGHAEVWVVGALMSFVMSASAPLCLEMAADAGYPVSEGTSTSIAVWLYNVFSFILLFLIGFLPSPLDANYIIFASLIVSIALLVLFTDKENRRLELDTHTHMKSSIRSTVYGSLNSTRKEDI